MDRDHDRIASELVLQLRGELFSFLITECSSYSLDDEEDCQACADKIAEWMAAEKVRDFTIDRVLPKARYRCGFNVVDEVSGRRIVRLELERDRMMTDGDFLQMQNFFWCTVGRAIAENPEVIRTLQTAGIKVYVGPEEGGGQLAPA